MLISFVIISSMWWVVLCVVTSSLRETSSALCELCHCQQHTTTLSPLSDLCRFASLVGLWVAAMIVGVLYKRFLLGAKGWEQVPFIDWYREFGNLQAVSCEMNYHY